MFSKRSKIETFSVKSTATNKKPAEKTRTDKVNNKIRKINRATEIKDVRSLKNFNHIMRENPHSENIQGYYVEIPLSLYQTYVPNSPVFPDRYEHHYSEGRFNSPLYTL